MDFRSTKSFDIIGAPFNQLGYLTTDQNTVDGLRQVDEKTWMGLSNWIDVRNTRWGCDINDTGDVLPNVTTEELIKNNQLESALLEYSERLSQAVINSYNNSRCPITIGGDHSIAVGTLMGTLDYYQKQQGEKVAVIWVDAHADCNSTEDSNLHGKPLALMTNEYKHNGWRIPEEITLRPDHIFYIGVRDFMPCEHEFIENSGATHFSMQYLDTVCMQGVLDELMIKMESFDRIYLSFDYDALDGSTFRACATPNVGGLSAREALHLVHTVSSNPKFVGADFVEYMPELDESSVSKELMVKLVDAVWGFRS